jgi:hypothetical protein
VRALGRAQLQRSLRARIAEPYIMRSLKSEERRTVPRYSLERMAKIQLGYDVPPTYCLVTDISEGGVRLYLKPQWARSSR